jgi:hypothetical protein
MPSIRANFKSDNPLKPYIRQVLHLRVYYAKLALVVLEAKTVIFG